MPERFGSFTIIVLGIAILGVVNGIATHQWTLPSMISAALGLAIAFSLWWIYFDGVDGSEIRALRENKQLGVYVSWLYIHFPLIIGFTALGVSIEHIVLSNQSIVLPPAEVLLMCISTSLCMFALGVIQITSAKSNPKLVNSKGIEKYRESAVSIGLAISVLIVGFASINGILPVFLIGMMAASFIGLVVLDIKRHPHHRNSKF